jgi:hypothetical protein
MTRRRISLYQIDAFSDRVFTGNPAAVCPLKDWLPDNVMQSIAAENNLSETAFFVSSAMVTNCAGSHPLQKWIFVDMRPWPLRLSSLTSRIVIKPGCIFTALKILRQDEKDVLQFANQHRSASIGRLLSTRAQPDCGRCFVRSCRKRGSADRHPWRRTRHLRSPESL